LQTHIFYKSGTIEPIQPSSAAASAAADTASVLLSPLSVWLRAVFQVQDPEAVVFWSPGGVRDALAGRGTPSSGLRRRLGSRCSPFSGGPRSCAALDQRHGCPRLRLEWREVSGGGCVPGPPAASCSSAPFDSLAGSSPRQSVKQTQVSAKIRIFTACKDRSSGDLKQAVPMQIGPRLISCLMQQLPHPSSSSVRFWGLLRAVGERLLAATRWRMGRSAAPP